MNYYLLVLAISLFPLISIFINPSFPHSHDGTVHLARMGAYFKALSDGQIPVRWAGDLNYGYGLPLFNFIYQLPYAIASLFLFLGMGLVNSFKITLSLSFILSGIFMFAFTRAFFHDNKKALLATIFYQYVPFRLVEILIRGSFGEVYTYTFLPLVLFGLALLLKKFTYKNFFLAAFASSLLILSHNSLSLVFFGVSFLFVLFFANNKKEAIAGICSLGFGLFLSAFYWIPAIFEHKYTYGDLFMRDVYLSHFPPWQNFLIPNLINSKALQTEGVSVQLGIFHTVAIALAVMIFILGKKLKPQIKKIMLFSLVLFVTAIFFMNPISQIFWQKISYLRQFQFPWRFLALSAFATSMLSISFFSYKIFNKKLIFYSVIFLTIASTIYYWKPSLGYDKINENYYWNFPLNTTYYGETDVIWSAGPAREYPKQRIDVIGGEAIIKNFNKKSQIQTFTVDAKTAAQLVSHTQYFPGWKVYVNGQKVPIQFQDQHWRGEITFYVPKGTNNVKVVFGESRLRLLADLISLSTLIILLPLFILKKKIL